MIYDDGRWQKVWWSRHGGQAIALMMNMDTNEHYYDNDVVDDDDQGSGPIEEQQPLKRSYFQVCIMIIIAHL